MTSFTSFGPGKIILFGEHAAVYGQPAIAGSLSRGVQATATPAKSAALKLERRIDSVARGALEKAFNRALTLTGAPPVQVKLTSQLPLSMGLGSSGAVSVALARVLLASRGVKDQKQVESVAMEMEKVFHGKPSGIDHTTSAREGLLLFEGGRIRRLTSPRPLRILVCLVGERPSTRSMVEGLRERQARWPRRYRPLFAQLGSSRAKGRGPSPTASSRAWATR